jgi:hypothetical protein
MFFRRVVAVIALLMFLILNSVYAEQADDPYYPTIGSNWIKPLRDDSS